MKSKIKIWYHSGHSSDIKELSVHKAILGSMLLIVFFALTAVSLAGYDYFQLKKNSFNNQVLQDTIGKQKNEISTQRSQVQSFAEEIEILKASVNDLLELEKKVRVIADIKQTSDSSGLIGIGGVPKEVLDQDIPLEKKHNNLMREMHEQVNQTNLVAKKHVLDLTDLITLLEKKRNVLASTPSIKPIIGGWITSNFGYRKSPFTGKKDFHSGLDISNRSGTKVVATANGRVSFAAKKMHIGNLVMIDHGYGWVTKYGHLKKILVKRGQTVKRGDVIALLGNTGKSTGPHVHYEVTINGTPVNPKKYILN